MFAILGLILLLLVLILMWLNMVNADPSSHDVKCNDAY